MVPCISAMVSARHVLAVGAASHVFTMQNVSHVSALWGTSLVLIVFVCMGFARWRWSILACRRSVRTTFEKFHEIGYLMVPSQSARLTNMCGTTLASVGRHWSARTTEETSLHTYLEAHMLSAMCHGLCLSCADHISCAVRAGPLARIGLLSLISHLNHVFRQSCTLQMVHLRPPMQAG